MRINIVLACTVCKSRTYPTAKNKKNTADRIEIKKFCPRCRKHEVHKEVK